MLPELDQLELVIPPPVRAPLYSFCIDARGLPWLGGSRVRLSRDLACKFAPPAPASTRSRLPTVNPTAAKGGIGL